MSPFVTTVAIFATSGVAAFAARTFTKYGLQFMFERRLGEEKFKFEKELEVLKQQYREELAQLKSANDKELALVRGEVDARNNAFAADNKAKEVALVAAGKARAAWYPKLVTCLRAIKSRLEYLHTASSEALGIGPIELNPNSDDAKLVVASLKELLDLEQQFDSMLSEVRFFTRRSDFELPLLAKHFAHGWLTGGYGDHFQVSQDQMRRALLCYSDDITFLAGEFYGGPYFDVPGAENPALQLQMKYFFKRPIQQKMP